MKNRKLWVSILAGIMAAVMLLSLIASLIPSPVSAASSSEIRKQINELKKQNQEIKEQKEEVQNQYEETENELQNLVIRKNVIDQEIFLQVQQIDNIQQQLAAFNLLIADKQDELDIAQENLNELNAKNKERIRSMEEEGELSYWSVLFKAKSFSDLLDRLNMIQEIAAADQRRLEALSAAAKEVANAKDVLASEKLELQATADELDAAYAELAAKQEEANELLQQLLAKRDELEALYEGYEAEEEALLLEIAQKEQEYDNARFQEYLAWLATSEPPTTAPPPTPEPTPPPAEDSGSEDKDGSGQEDAGEDEQEPEAPAETKPSTGSVYWVRPCSYILVSSPFGNRNPPTAGASRDHMGIDLAGREGTPIVAAAAGVVTAASYSNSAGYFVTIKHNNTYSSIYMHMTGWTVSAGQQVSAGQLIGYMGNTGISTGPHLHFGIMQNGVYVNPAAFIGF